MTEQILTLEADLKPEVTDGIPEVTKRAPEPEVGLAPSCDSHEACGILKRVFSLNQTGILTHGGFVSVLGSGGLFLKLPPEVICWVLLMAAVFCHEWFFRLAE